MAIDLFIFSARRLRRAQNTNSKIESCYVHHTLKLYKGQPHSLWCSLDSRMGNSGSRSCGSTLGIESIASTFFLPGDHSGNAVIDAILREDHQTLRGLLGALTQQQVDEEQSVTLNGVEWSLTPLMVAGAKGNIEAINTLLRSGKCTVTAKTAVHDPPVLGRDGRTALMMAAEFSRTKAVEVLFNAGASVNRKDASGRSSLCIAAASCDDTDVDEQVADQRKNGEQQRGVERSRNEARTLLEFIWRVVPEV